MGAVLSFRPAELKHGRYRVDIHDFDHGAHVIVWQGRAIEAQRNFESEEAAVIYARGIADDRECPLIRLNHKTVEEGA